MCLVLRDVIVAPKKSALKDDEKVSSLSLGIVFIWCLVTLAVLTYYVFHIRL